MIQKTALVLITLFTLYSCVNEAQKKDETTTPTAQNWKTEVEKTIKLYGHRNWIVVADGAYPKQSNPAIKTIVVDANQLEVVQFVNEVIKKSTHVQAIIFLDKEKSSDTESVVKTMSAASTTENGCENESPSMIKSSKLLASFKANSSFTFTFSPLMS